MSYTLQLLGDGSDTRDFTFVVESDNQKGWAWMRLIRIEDNRQRGPDIPRIVNYDPAIHDGKGHYMSYLWRARSSKQRNGPKSYALVGAFGDPGSYIPLTPLSDLNNPQ
jgi:hypothetical protein